MLEIMKPLLPWFKMSSKTKYAIVEMKLASFKTMLARVETMQMLLPWYEWQRRKWHSF